MCSITDYNEKINKINKNYDFKDNNIFFIKIYDKSKILNNMKKKYSYFENENILQEDSYIYTKEFNFITNSIITDYNTSEDYYEGYIKKIINENKLLDYIKFNFIHTNIIKIIILYNKYLSIFNKKLIIKIQNNLYDINNENDKKILEDPSLFLKIDINNVTIIEKNISTNEIIEQKYDVNKNDIVNYFQSYINKDIIINNYDNYNKQKYLFIDNFYVDALGNYLYIDRIF